MSLVATLVLRRIQEEEGQDLLEYGLLAALISIFAFAAVTLLGQTINTVFWVQISNLVQNL